MPTHAETNLYPGVNPHLNSALQQPGGDWRSFHAAHLIHIFDTLDEILPTGYYAKPEMSLQIGTYDARTETIADVLILKRQPGETLVKPSSPGTSPTFVLPITQIIDEEDELNSVLIYNEQSGKPVTRIELLSPANKPWGSHYGTYITKRSEALLAGLRLVEIDFLHERRPVVEELPSYPDQDEGAFPYYITVTDPRPTPRKGTVTVYGFSVLDPLPNVDIPLDEDDRVRVDFATLYNRTFSRRPFRLVVDYEQEPVNFETYTEADREKIRQHMKQVTERQS